MLFNSYSFVFLFLPIAAAGYLLLARLAPPILSIVWLAAASYLFFLRSELIHPFLILVSIAVNYTAGLLIDRAEGRNRKLLLALGVIFDLALLIYFKYTNFLLAQFVGLGIMPGGWAQVILPIGISFFTFTQIAYLADVHAGKPAERSVAAYFLFVSFFPHLVAGPILHHREMIPQFRSPTRQAVGNGLYAGIAMFAIGLAKKVLLADPAGQIATGIFAGSGHMPLGLFTSWIGAIAYTLQIYFDFSGYSDMAVGISRMMGIELPINFNSPYKAASITEFWRRWHISLSRFLRDYLYIPLGGNRKGVARRYLNLIVTMVLGGIWHGAGWTFLIWGALHGGMQALAQAWRDFVRPRGVPAMPVWLGWLLTTLFVIVAWVPFRAPDMHVAGSVWAGMAGLHGLAMPGGGGLAARLHLPLDPIDFGAKDAALILFGLLVAVLAPNSQQLLRHFNIGLDSPGYAAHGKPSRIAVRPTLGWAIALGLLFGLGLRSVGGYSEFIYFQF